MEQGRERGKAKHDAKLVSASEYPYEIQGDAESNCLDHAAPSCFHIV